MNPQKVKFLLLRFIITIAALAFFPGCAQYVGTYMSIHFAAEKKTFLSVSEFKNYYQMAQFINDWTLPVGLTYFGLWHGNYLISINTNRKSWLGFLGDEEIDDLQLLAISERDADKAGVVFPKDGMPDSEMKHFSPKHSLDDIYKIWQQLRLPMPILGRATLDNWTIPKNSILLPENARRYNEELNRQKQDH